VFARFSGETTPVFDREEIPVDSIVSTWNRRQIVKSELDGRPGLFLWRGGRLGRCRRLRLTPRQDTKPHNGHNRYQPGRHHRLLSIGSQIARDPIA
jgi:hypothetical protein